MVSYHKFQLAIQKLFNKDQTAKSTIKDDQNRLDSPFTLNEQQDKIQTLQPKKACGVDGILN